MRFMNYINSLLIPQGRIPSGVRLNPIMAVLQIVIPRNNGMFNGCPSDCYPTYCIYSEIYRTRTCFNPLESHGDASELTWKGIIPLNRSGLQWSSVGRCNGSRLNRHPWRQPSEANSQTPKTEPGFNESGRWQYHTKPI